MENGKDLSVNRNLVKFSKICVNDLTNDLIFKIISVWTGHNYSVYNI